MQAPEYDAVFGPEPQKYGFVAANFEKLRDSKAVKLNGDHDVFGDGSVVIKSAPGHTPGHQVLFVRLPKTGPVMLSGDMVHLTVQLGATASCPSFNFNVAAEQRAPSTAMKAFAGEDRRASSGSTTTWRRAQAIPKAPAFVE